MDVSLHPPMLPTRPCRFCLCLQGGSVFADFDVDPDGRVFLVRISFDGYGCCRASADIGRMSGPDSETLLAAVERGEFGPEAEAVLCAYFREPQDVLWGDALAHHGLV